MILNIFTFNAGETTKTTERKADGFDKDRMSQAFLLLDANPWVVPPTPADDREGKTIISTIMYKRSTAHIDQNLCY